MDTSAKCFSCMSEIYETMWSEIDGVYKKPKDFTDECNAENISPTLVRTISCPHVCVSIKEDIKVGDTITKGYIRGCMDSILKNDFNQTIVNLYRWLHKDACIQKVYDQDPWLDSKTALENNAV
uniref:Uncharacterized protein n=2 Tax=Acrobeloides nanus TaxID=290746 RepID=A0A914CHM4_9BILA